MRKQLEKKLATEDPTYSRLELKWLIEHIGDANPAIRDNLVYNSFGYAIMNHFFTREDFSFLVESILKQNLLFYRISDSGDATLTRSFTALLLALILDADNNTESLYHHSLSTKQLQTLFAHALLYLRQETDYVGWDQEKGWIHSVAHGAELLLYAGLHKQFPQEKIREILDIVVSILKREQTLFTAGEDRRIAFLLIQLVIHGKIQQAQLCQWIENLDFPDQTPKDYFALVNLENILSTIYLQLEKEGLLESTLKTCILDFWKGY